MSITLPLSGSAGALIPVGHQRPWDNLAAAAVKSLELLADWRGPYEPGSVTLKLSQLTLQPRQPQPGERGAIVTDVDLARAPASSRVRGMLSFRIEPPPSDPFAPSGDGDVRVVQADGRECLAFLDQPLAYVNDGPAARSIPVGRPVWRAYVAEPALGSNASFQIKSGARTWEVKNLRLPDIPAPLPH